MGLSRTVSEIKAISVENRKFFPPRVFCSPAERIPLELGTGAWVKKNHNDGTTKPNKKFEYIFSCVDTMRQRDRQTDGRTDTGRQQRPRLRIASRGKNKKAWWYSTCTSHVE